MSPRMINEENLEEAIANAKAQRAYRQTPEGKWALAWKTAWIAIAAHYGKFPCRICGGIDPDNINEPGQLCDGCYFGMRMDPEGWAAGMQARGIEVEYTGGCHMEPVVDKDGNVVGSAIACFDPYKKVEKEEHSHDPDPHREGTR